MQTGRFIVLLSDQPQVPHERPCLSKQDGYHLKKRYSRLTSGPYTGLTCMDLHTCMRRRGLEGEKKKKKEKETYRERRSEIVQCRHLTLAR